MYLVRDIFQCKPGTSKQVAEMFKKTLGSMQDVDGFRNPRVMLDYVASYWTVVLDSEVDSLQRFETHMASFSKRPEVKEGLAGYMDLVVSGRREIYKIV